MSAGFTVGGRLADITQTIPGSGVTRGRHEEAAIAVPGTRVLASRVSVVLMAGTSHFCRRHTVICEPQPHLPEAIGANLRPTIIHKVRLNTTKATTMPGNQSQAFVAHGEGITASKQTTPMALTGYACLRNSSSSEFLGAKQPNRSADSRSSPAVGAQHFSVLYRLQSEHLTALYSHPWSLKSHTCRHSFPLGGDTHFSLNPDNP
jgi:hypothetical protein